MSGSVMSKNYDMNAQRQVLGDGNGASLISSDGVRRFETEIARLKKENAELRIARASLEANVKSRFNEIAELTRMLNRANAGRNTVEETSTAASPASKEDRMEGKALSEQTYLGLQQLAQQSAGNALGLFNARSAPGVAKGVTRLFQKRQRKGSTVSSLASKAELLTMSGLFDQDWYCEQYPDVGKSPMHAVEHYLTYGAVEGRNPGPLFDGPAYLRDNPDVAQRDQNPLVHYITNGCHEGRIIKIVE